MSNQITGQIIHVGQIEQLTDNLSKRIVVVKTEEKYPQEIPVELVNKTINDNTHLREGMMVTVEYYPQGRQGSNGRWYSSFKFKSAQIHS